MYKKVDSSIDNSPPSKLVYNISSSNLSSESLTNSNDKNTNSERSRRTRTNSDPENTKINSIKRFKRLHLTKVEFLTILF